MTDSRKAVVVLTMNTLAFTVCFACWLMYSILIAHLVSLGSFQWTASQVGALVAIPVLTGSLARLPVGVLTDMFGGRIVYGVLMLLSAIPLYLVSEARSYNDFWWAGLGFGLTGASFAVGIAYTSVWFPKERQGTVLGIFGAGNAGAAITTFGAPLLLTHLDDWRMLPRIYAGLLVLAAVLFFLFTHSKKIDAGERKNFFQRLAPLQNIRVWRFGLYYFLVFGAFVALTNWLPIYYMNVYELDLVTAGLLCSSFVLPFGIIRALGGWLSDFWGARKVMYGVLGVCVIGYCLLVVPNAQVVLKGLDVRSAVGSHTEKAVVTEVTDEVIRLRYQDGKGSPVTLDHVLLSDREHANRWHETKVQVGAQVIKGDVLARGFTKLSLGFDVVTFTIAVFIIGIAMGIGTAAVYRHIPDYFPDEVGVVGGMVGVIGGLGGYFCPRLFGYLLDATGVWTTCWIFLAALSSVCLVWMHLVIKRMMVLKRPDLEKALEELLENESVVIPLMGQRLVLSKEAVERR